MFIVAACMLLSQFAFSQSSELKVMSYNVRIGSANDGTNSWIYRYPATLEMIKDQLPDVLGVQEALQYQVTFIDELAPEYDYAGVGRDNGKTEGEYMAIFWNKKKVKLLDWGTFWLSETPDKPSKGWDAKYNRTATWAIMKDKASGERFCVVNTHLDHVGAEARKNGLKLIIERMGEINPKGYPTILMGDFNMKPSAAELKGLDSCMKSARKYASKKDSHQTFNGWGKADSDMIIDYIYYSGFASCDRKFISDHYPIFARFIF